MHSMPLFFLQKFKSVPGKSLYRQYLESLQTCDQSMEAQVRPEVPAIHIASSTPKASVLHHEDLAESELIFTCETFACMAVANKVSILGR